MAASTSQDCTFRNIQALPQDEVCAFVDSNCTVENLVRFSYFYFCQVNQNIIVLDLLTILVPFYAFRMLSQTSEYYLSPALAKISKCFKLSQTVAGVTLLALGNGAPDVITAVVAGGSGNDSITIAVGSIFGAGLFVTTFTCAKVILNGGLIQIKPRTFTRDMAFYLIGACVILIYTIIGNITLLMALIFIGIYGIFLCVVVYQDHLRVREEAAEKKLKKMDTLQTQKIEDIQLEIQLEQIRNEQIPGDNQRRQSSNPAIILNTEQAEPNNNDRNEEKSFVMQAQEEGPKTIQMEDYNTIKKQDTFGQQQDGYETIKRQETTTYPKTADEENSSDKVKDVMFEKYDNFKYKFENMNLGEKFLAITEIPVDAFRYLTIPPAEETQWNKYRALITCYTAPIVFYWSIGGNWNQNVQNIEGFLVVYLLLAISFVLSLIIIFFTKNNEVPCFMWVISICSFIVAVVLLGQVAQSLIDFINFFQILTRLNKTFLGMTILAWGNSATDYFLNSSLAKIGYGVMAMTGCFAGQAFDLYIGFGFAMVLYSRQSNNSLSIFNGSSTLDWINNSIAITIVLSTIISTSISLFCGFKQNFTYEKGKYTFFLKNYYICVLCLSITLCAIDQFFE